MNLNLKQKDIPRFQELDTPKGKKTVPIEVRRSRRAKYIRLSVSPQQVVKVTIPWRAKEEDGLNFLASRSEWVFKRMDQLKKHPTLVEFVRAKKSLSICGCSVKLELIEDPSRNLASFGMTEENRFRITMPEVTNPQLKVVLRRVAAKALTDRVLHLAERLKLKVEKVSVRDQLTVWGSCSSKRMISLNWRLILVEPELQDYIIYHELAHLTHMNHSKAYWKLVQQYDCESLEHDQRISEISSLMMSLGR